jgi:hypothetical protein
MNAISWRQELSSSFDSARVGYHCNVGDGTSVGADRGGHYDARCGCTWSGWSGERSGRPHGGIAKQLKDITNYVVARTGGVDTSWLGSVPLRDIADVKRLREELGQNLVTQAASNLCMRCSPTLWTRWAFSKSRSCSAAARSCSRTAAPHSYKLTSSRVSSMALMIAHFERAGEIKIGDTALDSPSDAERARRERMKREG